MCRELSAVFTYCDGALEMYRSPYTDAHQDLLEVHNLVRGEDRCACVEYSPTDYSRAHEAPAWNLSLDDDRAPTWWAEQEHAVLDRMDKLREALTIREDALIIVGSGPYVLAPGVRVGRMVGCRILTMGDGATGGNYSKLTGGNYSKLTGGYSSNLTGGNGSKLRIDHGDHVHTATVGVDGVKAGHAYQVRNEMWELVGQH